MLAALISTGVGPASGAPFIDPGDLELREDIELLADAGVLSGPVSTWPLSWGDIGQQLEEAESTAVTGAPQREALLRLRRAAQLNRATTTRREFALGAATDPRPLRNFENTPREHGEVRASIERTGLRFAYRLQATLAADPADDRIVRADGSFVGVVLGNWMISGGQLERWWGPGRQGGLILSTNARPIPGLALQRNFSDPPPQRWLAWVGPWTITALMGQLEHGRTIADPLFFGMRFNFRPLDSLEIGISRTAQWCGSDRPCDVTTFLDLLAGRDNRTENQVADDEPGNQLAGFDWRWRLPVAGGALAWYGEWIGEDEAGNMPSRFIGLSGLSWRAPGAVLGGSLSGHFEWADTVVEFYKDAPRFDLAYEHAIYEDGYRYRDRSIGHSMDSDSRMWSVGVALRRGPTSTWRALVRRYDLNRGGSRATPVAATSRDLFNIELSWARSFAAGRLDVGIGIDDYERPRDDDDNDIRLHARWRSEM